MPHRNKPYVEGSFAADHFVCGISKHPLGGLVEQFNYAMLIDEDNAIDRRFEDRVEPGFNVPRLGLRKGWS